MKKCIGVILIVLLLVSSIHPVMANDGIKVEIDGQQIMFDVPPMLINGRTMVPLRTIFEALGASVVWNDASQSVISTKGDVTVSLTINSSTMYVNKTEVILDSPPCIINGRTLVPVRAVSEAFGTSVKWIDKENSVVISTDNSSSDVNVENGAIALVDYIVENGIEKGIAYYIAGECKMADCIFTTEIRYIPSTGNLEFVQFSESGEISVNVGFILEPETQTIKGNEIFGTYTNGEYFCVLMAKSEFDGKSATVDPDFKITRASHEFNDMGYFCNVFNDLAKIAFDDWRTLIIDSGIDINSIGISTEIEKESDNYSSNYNYDYDNTPSYGYGYYDSPSYSYGYYVPSSSVIESRIDGSFEGWDGDTVFKLTNGQIWQQSKYDYYYTYKYRPEVVIYKSGIGYKMLIKGTEKEVDVKRLK